MSAADFYMKPYGWIFNACADLSMTNQPVSIETVTRRLADMKLSGGQSPLDAMGGTTRLAESVEGVLPDEYLFWSDRVRDKRMERDALAAVTLAQRRIQQGGDVRKMLAEIEQEIASVGRGDTGSGFTLSASESMSSVMERIDGYIADPDSIAGLPTYWNQFDHLIDGFKGGNVYMFYARSSQFKSWFTTQIGYRISREGVPGHWFTTEMPHRDVMERVLQFESGVNIRWARRDGSIGGYADRLRHSAKRIASYPITICDRSVDIAQLRAETMRRRRWDGIEYIIIDLISMVSTGEYKDDSIAKQSAVQSAVKDLAKDAEIPIICVMHVGKNSAQTRTSDYRKTFIDMEDMKGSSSLYQDVDLAASIVPVRINPEDGYWQGMLRNESSFAASESGGGRLTINVEVTKNRQGELGNVKFDVDFTHGGQIEERQAHTLIQQSFVQ